MTSNVGTIHIHKVLRYLRECIKRAAISAVQQPSLTGHGANLRKRGCEPKGLKTTLVLLQTFEGIFSTRRIDVFTRFILSLRQFANSEEENCNPEGELSN
jgi:hypothetical protein